jgi:N-methylhydantoinase B/oxoprolinase/acetone carboxylase alpha subunit
MTRTDEDSFLANLSGAMRRSADVHALEVLWRDYEAQIAACSQEGRDELRRFRAERGRELMTTLSRSDKW